MTNDVRIEFMGLTGIVPNRKDAKAPFKTCLAVLPDLLSGEDHKSLPRPLRPHTPAIVVPTRSVIRESRKHAAMTFRCRDGEFTGQHFSLYMFNYESLRFAGLTQGDLEVQETPVDPQDQTTHKPDPGEEQELQWVARMALARTASDSEIGIFDRGKYLNQDYTPRKTGAFGLVGTVQIDCGRLYAEDVVRDGGDPVLFKIMPHKSTVKPNWQQAMYSRLYCDAALDAEQLDLVFLRPSGDRGTISLRPINGLCDVRVANLELETLLGLDYTKEPDEEADLDFAVFYLYSKGSLPTDLPVPHADGEYLAGGNPRCKVQRFEM